MFIQKSGNGELKQIAKGKENNDSSYRKHSGNTFIRVISPISKSIVRSKFINLYAAKVPNSNSSLKIF